jgi:hypothetical protein
MRLLGAWIASALAGAAAYPIGLCVAIWLLEKWIPGPDTLAGRSVLGLGLMISILRMVPYVFVACLVVQLIYGGLLYVLFRSLGWFNLPVVLLAYIVPVAALALMSDVPKDAIMQISNLTCGVALAVMGWLLARTCVQPMRC